MATTIEEELLEIGAVLLSKDWEVAETRAPEIVIDTDFDIAPATDREANIPACNLQVTVILPLRRAVAGIDDVFTFITVIGDKTTDETDILLENGLSTVDTAVEVATTVEETDKTANTLELTAGIVTPHDTEADKDLNSPEYPFSTIVLRALEFSTMRCYLVLSKSYR